MRTKTLLLTAALGAAGVASSMAQAVYSVNAVGYVNTTLKPGFNLVSNPLDAGAGNNTVERLFNNVSPAVPNLLTVYYFNGTRYLNAAFDDIDGWGGEAATQVVAPGDGVFVLNPETTDLTVTFVGEVPQGNLVNPLPQGFSIQASQVPQAGRVTADLGLPPAQGDTIYKYNTTTRRYDNWAFDDLAGDNGAWTDSQGNINEPSLAVGEAFFLLKGAAGSWNRTFSVNP